MRGCGGVCAPARCRGDGSDSAMAASMFYGRQLAAAALRSHRPQPTLRAAAQVGPPSPLQPRGVGGRAAGLSAALARPGCLAGRSGEAASQECEPALQQLRSAPARVLGRPGPASWLPASAPGAWRGSPRAARCRPGRGSTLPGSFWVRGMPFKCTFASRELSSSGKGFGAPAESACPPSPNSRDRSAPVVRQVTSFSFQLMSRESREGLFWSASFLDRLKW